MTDRHIAVTGATGFVGQHVVSQLEQRGCTVFRLGRAAEDDYHLDLQRMGWPRVNADSLVHLAWMGLPAYGDALHLRQVPAHIAMVEEALRQGIEDITIAGTCFEYGMQEGALHENLPAIPAINNLYAQAKDLLRQEVESLCRAAGVRFKWVRLFYLFGEQQRNTLYTQLLRAIEDGDEVFNLSPGDQIRDFIPVEVAADNLVQIALQSEVTGVINDCMGAGSTVRHFVETVLAKEGAAIRLNLGYYPYSEFEPFAFWGDPTKLNEAKEAFQREYRV